MDQDQLFADIKKANPNVEPVRLSEEGEFPIRVKMGNDTVIFPEGQNSPQVWFGVRTEYGYQAVQIPRSAPSPSIADTHEVMALAAQYLEARSARVRESGESEIAERLSRLARDLRETLDSGEV